MYAILFPSLDHLACSTSYSPSVSCLGFFPIRAVKTWVLLPSKVPTPFSSDAVQLVLDALDDLDVRLGLPLGPDP
jgi:hypothetical protein